jgi:hypothetical protein
MQLVLTDDATLQTDSEGLVEAHKGKQCALQQSQSTDYKLCLM